MPRQHTTVSRNHIRSDFGEFCWLCHSVVFLLSVVLQQQVGGAVPPRSSSLARMASARVDAALAPKRHSPRPPPCRIWWFARLLVLALCLGRPESHMTTVCTSTAQSQCEEGVIVFFFGTYHSGLTPGSSVDGYVEITDPQGTTTTADFDSLCVSEAAAEARAAEQATTQRTAEAETLQDAKEAATAKPSAQEALQRPQPSPRLPSRPPPRSPPSRREPVPDESSPSPRPEAPHTDGKRPSVIVPLLPLPLPPARPPQNPPPPPPAAAPPAPPLPELPPQHPPPPQQHHPPPRAPPPRAPPPRAPPPRVPPPRTLDPCAAAPNNTSTTKEESAEPGSPNTRHSSPVRAPPPRAPPRAPPKPPNLPPTRPIIHRDR